MRVHIDPTSDIIEHKRRARQTLAALKEFGAGPRMKDGKFVDSIDSFDVDLPRGMDAVTVGQLLEAVGARGVSLQPEDMTALVSDPYTAKFVTELLEKKMVDGAHLPVDEVAGTVNSWAAAAWLNPGELTEIEEEEIYNKIVERLPDYGTELNGGAKSNGAEAGSLREMLDESDAWLKEHAAENPGKSYENTWSVR